MKTTKVMISLLGLIVFVSCQTATTATPTQIPPTPTKIPPTPTIAPPTPTRAPPTSTMSTGKGLSVAKPLYGARGNNQIRAENLTLQDTEGSLNIYVLYPYDIKNAKPDASDAPYPLIVHSPEGGGVGADHVPTLTNIASHGFVAMTYDARDDSWMLAAYRPLDIRRIIDYADKLTAPGGQMAGMIDTERIGVSGISTGGWAVLLGGGAQMDFGWCTANPDLMANPPFGLCKDLLPHLDELASLLGLKSTPSGLWPQVNDPRVSAVVAMSPDGETWGAEFEGVGNLKVPTLVMAGSADKLNPPEYTSYPIYEHIGSKQKTLLVIENGNHALNWATKQDVLLHIITAFDLAWLKDDPNAAQALLTENVTFPDIRYETTVTSTE